MSLVGKKAPLFKASAVIDGSKVVQNFSLEEYMGKNEIVLFFYPKDFSGLCPTEMHAFQEKLPEFEKRNVIVLACSTDSEETHLAWLERGKENGGIKGITYPIISDISKTISANYGVLAGDYDYNEDGELEFYGAPIALRGTFIIDKHGIIMHEYVNFFPLGRNIDEVLRMVDAVQYNQKHGEVCPANWKSET